MSEMRERLEELLFASSDEPFSEAERAELNALLRDNAEARTFAATHLTIDALLAESLAASEHTTAFRPIPISAGQSLNRPNWLARAAAWIGAFHAFSNTAKAATATSSAATSTTVLAQSTIIILMKKTVTSITAAILVLGSSGIYAIRHTNESSRNRLAAMETEIQSLSDQLGIKSTSSTQRKAGAGNSRKPVSVTQVTAILSDSVISSQELAQFEAFKEQLAAMDAESLKNLLLDAEKISSPIHGRVAEMIMKALIAKDSAVASQIVTQLIGRGSEFQFLLSSVAAEAFNAWLTKDPTAANAWYLETAAAGGFTGKSIPMNGLEGVAIDRSFARLRFASLVGSNPSEAAAMLATMLPADVTSALKSVTDPAALRQILPMLSPAQKVPAAEGAIKAMAANDLNAAFTWAKSLGMEDRERDTLLASGIEAAVASGKLDLTGVAEWSKNLNLDAERRSDLQVTAAVSSSFKAGEDQRAADWQLVADRSAWLRKEALSESANKMVGDYLGRVAYNSSNTDQSFKAYEQEVARMGNPDPELTIAYTFWLSRVGSNHLTNQALKYLHKLPASQEKDDAIRQIEMNR